MVFTPSKGEAKTSKEEELEEMCLYQERGGDSHKHPWGLERCKEALQSLSKLGERYGLKLKRDGRVCVEVEMKREPQAHH